MSIKVKICCIQDIHEARMAFKYGAHAIGLLSDMPTGLRMITDERIKSITRQLNSGVKTFLLTSRTKADDIIEHIRYSGANTVQIVDSPETGVYEKIRRTLPNIEIVQALHVTGEETLEEAKEVDGLVDYFLLDSGNPKLKVKVLGGTGKTHDWDVSAKIISSVKTPVYLAGGLNPENVAQAIEKVRPFGVDVCSGLRDPKFLIEEKLRDFMLIVKSFD